MLAISMLASKITHTNTRTLVQTPRQAHCRVVAYRLDTGEETRDRGFKHDLILQLTLKERP